jgi:hypothetical protein
MAPPRPTVAAPVPIQIWPLFPLLELPEENTRTPETPASPAFVLRIVTAPLVDSVPSPLLKLNVPPVCTVLRPENTCMPPPAPLVPLPTDKSTVPPRPTVAAPDPKRIEPLLPLLELPDENTRDPLAPTSPAFALRIITMPLLEAVPSPDSRINTPPVTAVERPAIMATMPP